jgi:hypothetical protein
MPKVQVSCPRCRQPLVAEVEQLFDLNVDPKAKQRFLSGSFNLADCKSCGHQGPLSMPLVYHDPEKELLLTYFPAELGLPVNEQERLIGPYIKQVVDKLPTEKRKAYLFRPQSTLTMQTMIDRVLEADGITRDMIENSQKRLNLIQRLLSASSKDVRAEIVRQDEGLIDESFFAMMSRLVEASMAGGDQNTARALAAMQQEILPLTEIGRRLQADSADVQAAVKELQQAGQQGLTRDLLADILIKHRSKPAVLNALTGLVRQGLDYEFFGILTKRIEQAAEADKPSISALRDTLLELVKKVDEAMKQQLDDARNLLDEILRQPNIEKAATDHLQEMDEFFSEVLRAELDQARKNSNYERSGRLQAIVEVLQKASSPPPEYELIEQLLGMQDDEMVRQALARNPERVTPEFMQMLNGLVAQMEGENQAEIAARLQDIYRIVLRFSMEQKLKH